MSSSSSDFYALTEILSEVGSVEDFIFDGLSAINGEAASNFSLNCLFLGCFLLGLGLSGDSGGCWLFCGHENKLIIIIN